MYRVKRDFGGAVLGLAAVAFVAGPAVAQPYIYPAKGQSPAQQQKDEGECRGWALQQPGAQPPPAPPPPPSAPQGPQGHVVRGGARGAALGAVGGAIAGNAGKGAAAGAAIGGLMGGFQHRDQQRAAQQSQQSYYQAQSQAQARANASYERALAACLEGRGYTVK